MVEFNECSIICEFIFGYQVFGYVRYIMKFTDFNEVPIRKAQDGHFHVEGGIQSYYSQLSLGSDFVVGLECLSHSILDVR